MNIGKKLKRVRVEPLELPKPIRKEAPGKQPPTVRKEEPVTVDK